MSTTNVVFVDKLRIVDGIVDEEVTLRLRETKLQLRPFGNTVEIPVSNATHFRPLIGRRKWFISASDAPRRARRRP